METVSEVRRKREFQSFWFFGFFLQFLSLGKFSDCQTDVLAQGRELRYGSQLISANGIFALGFYGPAYLNTLYLGIKLKEDSIEMKMQPVWLANRNSPFYSTSGLLSLTIDGNGSLKVVHKGKNGFSFSVYDVEEPTNTSAILFDNGNFVLRELNTNGSVKRQLWQSFDYPTDTLLEGMKLGINHRTGSSWSLTSWRGPSSPQSGAFTLSMNPNNTNQLVIFLRGDIFWTSGNWENGSFEFSEELSRQFILQRFSNENETYFNYSFSIGYGPFPTNQFGVGPPPYDIIQQALRLNEEGSLSSNDSNPVVYCNFFEDKFDYRSGFRSGDGCVWQKQHQYPKCRDRDSTFSFIERKPEIGRMEGDSKKYKESENLTQYECENICISDCDCVAYTYTNEEGTGCEIWKTGATFLPGGQDGRQIKVFNTSQNLHTYQHEPEHSKSRIKVWLIVGPTGAATILLLCFIFSVIWNTQIGKVIEKLGKKKDSEQGKFLYDMGVIGSKSLNILRTKNRPRRYGKKNSELQAFSFESVLAATNNFANENKLGQGGFGPVYKGCLPDGQEVAIKRLSKSSGQGLEEFKNETILIAKLQHTNLVRLIGYCIYKEEKMLIYEYMPNKSLDFFLFDPEKKLTLVWNRRFNIIEGIIQGLLYLHNYSRLRIIHRDLKASNILLDDEMNAKISDFGMARIFRPTDLEANTSRVVGTYGYISPEYAMRGIFSVKSDVYSFGVLLLEIITGRKNNNSDLGLHLNLIGYAWELWMNDRGEELIDSTLCNSDQQKSKALRCIHVSLLCVQQMPADRPTMLDVSFMIHNDSTQLSIPKQPAFFTGGGLQLSEGETTGRTQSTSETCSSNTMSISEVVGR